MQFNSLSFLCYFALVLIVHFLPLSWTVRKLNLLLASYLFYAAWNPPFVLLLVLSTLVDWWCARWIATSKISVHRSLALAFSMLVNLGLLVFFKYGGFVLENLQAILDAVGIHYQPPELDIILPIGISFYTFQTLSYTIDVYRGRSAAWHSPLDFALYVTFFPQLVAGPIVRATDFLPQCSVPSKFRFESFAWGLNLLLLGLFQKSVLADGFLAPVVDRVFAAPSLTSLSAWIGTLAFTGQIFCDFAGYSTCAIGVAMCLGFALPDNFRFPYAALGFSDFWSRWHISLSTWLRDYLYIPLGGNRQGLLRTYLNLMLTMLIGGLWHGAGWTFVAWGGLHGMFLIVERWLRGLPLAGWDIWRRRVGKLALAILTFFLVAIAWVFFRAASFTQAATILQHMFLLDGGTSQGLVLEKQFVVGVLVITLGLVTAHWWLRETTLEQIASRTPTWLLAIINAAMWLAIMLTPSDNRAFIYFQF